MKNSAMWWSSLVATMPEVKTPVRSSVSSSAAAAARCSPVSSRTCSVAELKRAIQEFLDQNNKAPRPFVWTKTADDILASID